MKSRTNYGPPLRKCPGTNFLLEALAATECRWRHQLTGKYKSLRKPHTVLHRSGSPVHEETIQKNTSDSAAGKQLTHARPKHDPAGSLKGAALRPNTHNMSAMQHDMTLNPVNLVLNRLD